jgi:pimeloyl-ACP methyl ester carboxylesterase
MRGRVVLTSLVCVLAMAGLAACSDDGGESESSDSTTADAVEPEPVTFEAAECPVPIPATVTVEIDCGFLVVPENRLDPDSNEIRLAVAHLHSPSPDAGPDPIIELAGGPGFPSLENIESWAGSSLLDARDIVLFDQRGLGHSEPNLDCPETNEAVWEIFATNDPPEVEGRVLLDATMACRDRLLDEGVDLDGYNTVQSAADVEDLRVALGFDEVNLRGVSYGSALAQMVLRNHPDGLRSVLLDSVVPPDVALDGVARGESALRAFEALNDACEADESCSPQYGNLLELFVRAAGSLDDDPYPVAVPDEVRGTDRDVVIDGGDFSAGLFNAMYDATLLTVIPGAALDVANGGRAIVDALAPNGIAFLAGQHEAMTMSVICADTGRIQEPDALEPFLAEHPEMAALVYFGATELVCPDWGVAEQPAENNELLTDEQVDVPVLVLAGAFDPITPPDGSRRVAEALGLELIVLPDAGHGGIGVSCGDEIWDQFLADPTAEIDTTCVDETPPLDFP